MRIPYQQLRALLTCQLDLIQLQPQLHERHLAGVLCRATTTAYPHSTSARVDQQQLLLQHQQDQGLPANTRGAWPTPGLLQQVQQISSSANNGTAFEQRSQCSDLHLQQQPQQQLATFSWHDRTPTIQSHLTNAPDMVSRDLHNLPSHHSNIWRNSGSSSSSVLCPPSNSACYSRTYFSSSGNSCQSSSDNSSTSSSSSSSWLQRVLPPALLPYAQLMRLDKPIGSWLLAWPGLWSIALVAAPGHLPDPWLTALFGTGAVLMRGAGCTINDLWDRDIDRQVERTRSRPLAAGTITPTAALVFLAAQLSASLAILLQLNTYTQVLGVASLSLVASYPLMKRITWWPQAFLGLAMNYGALMGYSAAAGACDWAVVAPLYAAGVSWTLIYDTIYAHQDKRDDALVGVKSTALLFGDNTKAWATGFAVTQALGMVLAGHAAGCGLPYFAGVAAGSAHIAWQIASVDLQNGPDCMSKFVSNKWCGALIYAGVVLDRLLAV